MEEISKGLSIEWINRLPDGSDRLSCLPLVYHLNPTAALDRAITARFIAVKDLNEGVARRSDRQVFIWLARFWNLSDVFLMIL